MKKINKKPLFVLLAILLAVVLFFLLFRAPPSEWDKARELGEYIESQGFLGVLVFFIIAALATSVGLPRQFFAFAAGFAFGVPGGVLVSSIAAICGCAITFYCSRRVLKRLVQSRYPNVIDALNKLLQTDVFLKIVVLRIQPLGTNLITNLCAGVTSIPAKVFFASSWLGYLPQMMVFSLLGAGVRIGSSTYLLYSISMLCLSFIIGGWLYKRYINQPAEREAT